MNDANKFLEKYEAHATLSDRKHYAKRMPMSLSDYHRYNTSMDVYDYESYVHREPYVEMYIPQHKFEELITQERYYAAMKQQADYSIEIINQNMKDEIVRKSNPAVKKAYENYKTLLELSRT